MNLDAFFFPTTDELRLFGVARGPKSAAWAWVLCPPFGEEEKSSRRIFTLISQQLDARGQASLLFSWRGTGDSEGDFAHANLAAWRRDLRAAKQELQDRAPDARIGFLGVRLGATLALQEAQTLGVERLILIEPLLSGRSFLMQQKAKKQIRAQMTGEKGENALPMPTKSDQSIEDLDGWPLGPTLKADLTALDLRRETSSFAGQRTVWQVGPRDEIAAALQDFSHRLGASSRAVVMPPFWNLIDAPDPAPLLDALQPEFEAVNRHD